MENFEMNENVLIDNTLPLENSPAGGLENVLAADNAPLPLDDNKQDVMTAPVRQNGMVRIAENINLPPVVQAEEAPARDTEVSDVLQDLGEEFGKIHYLSNEQNLALPPVNRDIVDEDAPFSSLSMAGKWLREAADLRNYWQGIERLGGDVAAYTWAYKQGDLGKFDGKAFAAEALKAGLRSVGRNTLRTTGNLLTMFGANLAEQSAATTLMTSGAGVMMPQAGKVFQEVGQALRSYAENVENLSFLQASPSAYEENPSWSKLANVVGSGSAQVLAMGAMSRLMGAGATYGFFAGGGSGEIFNESLAQDGDVEKANTLAAANAGVTFAIDKLFNPLPEMVAKNAKLTAKKVASEMLGAPLREAGSEVLQQMLAENLVRKVGLDDTQDLFEGLLESALGAFAGSSMLSGASGTVYLAGGALDKARRKIMLKGVSAEELDLYQKNMMALIETKPQAFEKILGANLKENLRQMDLAARQIKNRRERAVKRGELKEFDAVYDEMRNRFTEVLGDEAKAGAAAKVFEVNAISLYNYDNSLTPRKLLNGLLPQVEKVDIAAFLARQIPEEALSYSFIGINAKHANARRLTNAEALEKAGADPQLIWRRTGWHKGGDNKWRMEISDKNAVIKPWGDERINTEAEGFFDEYRIEMEKIRAYLAASLRKSTQSYGSFYQDFYDYLEKNSDTSQWLERDSTGNVSANPKIFEVIDAADRNKRAAEGLLLQDLMSKYREMHPEKKQAATLDEAFDELEKHQGKTYDFSEEEYNYIMGALEYSRRHAFFKRYWNDKEGGLRREEFERLAEAKNFENADNPQYLKGLAEVVYTAQKRRQERTKELERQGVYPARFFFEDIERNETYGKYRIYQGHFGKNDPDRSGTDFYPQSYKRAFRPLSMSEKFLEQEQYAYMKDIEKKRLASYLDNVERLFRVQKYLDETDSYREVMNAFHNADMKARDYDDYVGRGNKDLVQQRLLAQKRGDLRLGDIFEHPEIFANYPEAADMTVHFAKLIDEAPYHYYHDAKKGYVLEIDPDQLKGENLKEIFLRGAMFVVQDIEDFDYTLTKTQRRNFMNRQLFLAAEKIQRAVAENLEGYVSHYLPEANYRDFLVKSKMPVSLAGLAKSADIQNRGVDADEEIVHFTEVDYERLTEAVQEKYRYPQSVEGYPIRDLAYLDLQQIQRLNTSMLMATARANGGYDVGLMPWAGVTSQGAADERALVSRINLSEAELRQTPPFDDNRDLSSQKGEEGAYQPDTIDAYDEFAARIAYDAKNYRKTIEKLAEGAYNSANRTISLFQSANAATIVHETFHYFWDMMQQAENRSETHAVNFHSTMSELKEDFVRFYSVEEHDGKWYAVDKSTGEAAEELRRGFASEEEVINAGARELFVKRFMALLNNRTYGDTAGNIADTADFYRRWLLTLTDKLEISKDKAAPDGARLLKFLKNKIK